MPGAKRRYGTLLRRAPLPSTPRLIASVPLAGSGVPGTVPPITFPNTPLRVKVEVALGADVTADPATWSWADATGITFTRDTLTITRGRQDEAATADSCTLSFTGDNRGGHWSTRNPNSPWFGLIRKGSPIRVSVEGYVRFTGFLTELPPRWDLSGNDRYAPIKARGLLYRLSRTTAPVRSALRRAMPATAPAYYWPMEDGSSPTAVEGLQTTTPPTSLVSGLLTGSPVTFVNPNSQHITAGIEGRIVGSSGCLSIDCYDNGVNGPTGTIDGLNSVLLTGMSSTSFSMAFVYTADFAAVPITSIMRLFEIETTGGTGLAKLSMDIYGSTTGHVPDNNFGTGFNGTTAAGGPAGFAGYDSSTATPLPYPRPFSGDQHSILVQATQVGGNVSLRMVIDGQAFTGTAVGATMGTPTKLNFLKTDGLISFGGGADSGDNRGTTYGLGHFTLWGATGTPTDPYQASIGYAGEQAHIRFGRLCTQEGIRYSTQTPDSVTMGTQGIDSLVNLLAECEAADQGYMYEGLNFDLVFQGHALRENANIELALNYQTDGHIAPPFEPIDDDQKARNDVEVKRTGGSLARQIEIDPNVELSIPNIGRRDESVTLKLFADTQLPDLAGWRLHLLTWPGYRYPTLALNFAAAPSLIPAVCTAGLAWRTTISNTPTDIAFDVPDLIIEGYTETTGPYDWDLVANCSPFGPYRVNLFAGNATGDTAVLTGRDDWDSCVLAADLDTGTGSTTVNVTPLITTDPDDFPFDVFIDGEKTTVTNCTGASNPQTLTLTRSVNGIVKSHLAGAQVTLVNPLVLTL